MSASDLRSEASHETIKTKMSLIYMKIEWFRNKTRSGNEAICDRKWATRLLRFAALKQSHNTALKVSRALAVVAIRIDIF